MQHIKRDGEIISNDTIEGVLKFVDDLFFYHEERGVLYKKVALHYDVVKSTFIKDTGYKLKAPTLIYMLQFGELPPAGVRILRKDKDKQYSNYNRLINFKFAPIAPHTNLWDSAHDETIKGDGVFTKNVGLSMRVQTLHDKDHIVTMREKQRREALFAMNVCSNEDFYNRINNRYGDNSKEGLTQRYSYNDVKNTGAGVTGNNGSWKLKVKKPSHLYNIGDDKYLYILTNKSAELCWQVRDELIERVNDFINTLVNDHPVYKKLVTALHNQPMGSEKAQRIEELEKELFKKIAVSSAITSQADEHLDEMKGKIIARLHREAFDEAQARKKREETYQRQPPQLTEEQEEQQAMKQLEENLRNSQQKQVDDYNR